MQRKVIVLLAIVFGMTQEYVFCQDHLEPVEDFWSIYDLRTVATARDSLLLGFNLYPLVRVISLPDDGHSWAVNLERLPDSTYVVRTARVSGSLALRGIMSTEAKELVIQRSIVKRNVRIIDRDRANAAWRSFFVAISTARYPHEDPDVIDGATVYFAAREPKQRGVMISARTLSAVEGKLPGLLTSFARTLFEYGHGLNTDSIKYLARLDSLGLLLSN